MGGGGDGEGGAGIGGGGGAGGGGGGVGGGSSGLAAAVLNIGVDLRRGHRLAVVALERVPLDVGSAWVRPLLDDGALAHFGARVAGLVQAVGDDALQDRPGVARLQHRREEARVAIVERWRRRRLGRAGRWRWGRAGSAAAAAPRWPRSPRAGAPPHAGVAVEPRRYSRYVPAGGATVSTRRRPQTRSSGGSVVDARCPPATGRPGRSGTMWLPEKTSRARVLA